MITKGSVSISFFRFTKLFKKKSYHIRSYDSHILFFVFFDDIPKSVLKKFIKVARTLHIVMAGYFIDISIAFLTRDFNLDN